MIEKTSGGLRLTGPMLIANARALLEAGRGFLRTARTGGLAACATACTAAGAATGAGAAMVRVIKRGMGAAWLAPQSGSATPSTRACSASTRAKMVSRERRGIMGNASKEQAKG